jgi:hypothetical protein
LEPLSNVTSVSENFLAGCSSLKAIDLSVLGQITEINRNFLRNCSSLETINLEPLSNVTSISLAFLKNCSSLITVDISKLTQLKKISPSNFLADCTKLEKVYIIKAQEDIIRNVSHLQNKIIIIDQNE